MLNSIDDLCLEFEPCEDKENVDPDVQQGEDLLSGAQLKKKEVQSKKSRRTKT